MAVIIFMTFVSALLVVAALIYIVLRQARREGALIAQAEQTKADLNLSQKQAEIMAERREIKDVLDRLDGGSI
jgi:hypothetical protein